MVENPEKIEGISKDVEKDRTFVKSQKDWNFGKFWESIKILGNLAEKKILENPKTLKMLRSFKKSKFWKNLKKLKFWKIWTKSKFEEIFQN